MNLNQNIYFEIASKAIFKLPGKSRVSTTNVYPKGQKLENMLSWRHSGFHVYIGGKIFSDDKAGLGNLADTLSVPVSSAKASLRVPGTYGLYTGGHFR